MMRLLLDTHALLWMLYDDPRLPTSARRHITQAEEIAYSSISLWEIAIKLSYRAFDFRLADNWHQLLPKELTHIGAYRLDITPECLHKLQTLPFHHRDPFDRMIISQALTEHWDILSKDGHLKKYGLKVFW